MKELKIRLQEQLRIYKASQGVTVTYIDLARVVEDLIEVIDCVSKSKIGFIDESTKPN